MVVIKLIVMESKFLTLDKLIAFAKHNNLMHENVVRVVNLYENNLLKRVWENSCKSLGI